MQNHDNSLARCQNKERRVNLKSKRKRNLIKKSIELSKMLDMKVLILFKDLDTEKISIYNSGDQATGHFNLETALQEVQLFQDKGNVIKSFDDEDYDGLKVGPAKHGGHKEEIQSPTTICQSQYFQYQQQNDDQEMSVCNNDEMQNEKVTEEQQSCEEEGSSKIETFKASFLALEKKLSTKFMKAQELCDEVFDEIPS